jgi:hypothetical protein
MNRMIRMGIGENEISVGGSGEDRIDKISGLGAGLHPSS